MKPHVRDVDSALIISLLRLESALAVLERRAARPSSSWQSRLHVRLALFWLLAATSLVLWFCFLLVPGRFYHPHYMVAMFVPEALHMPPRYWAAITYQVATRRQFMVQIPDIDVDNV